MTDRNWLWWMTTVLGAMGAALAVVAPEIGGSTGDVLLKIAAAISMGLGATHPGRKG